MGMTLLCTVAGKRARQRRVEKKRRKRKRGGKGRRGEGEEDGRERKTGERGRGEGEGGMCSRHQYSPIVCTCESKIIPHTMYMDFDCATRTFKPLHCITELLLRLDSYTHDIKVSGIFMHVFALR